MVINSKRFLKDLIGVVPHSGNSEKTYFDHMLIQLLRGPVLGRDGGRGWRGSKLLLGSWWPPLAKGLSWWTWIWSSEMYEDWVQTAWALSVVYFHVTQLGTKTFNKEKPKLTVTISQLQYRACVGRRSCFWHVSLHQYGSGRLVEIPVMK